MKKTKLFLTLFIAIMTLQSYSQNSNELRIYSGISDSELLRNQNLDGALNYEMTNFNEFGLRYLRQISNNISIEGGINFSKVNLKYSPPFIDNHPVRATEEKLEIVSIPIYANYTFWKYLFVNGGPILDFQTSDNSTDSQSGIGYSIGIGGKYDFNKFLIYVNPNYKRHAVLPFEKENYHQKLTEFGIQFGLGYKF